MPNADTPLRHVLVTDFDGTITRRDFFWLVVEAFAPAHLEEHWRKYTTKQITHFEALAGIFDKLELSEEAMNALLDRAEPEPELRAWLDRLDRGGWDVVVVSAGCSWYIERILARAGVTLPIHSNPGTFIPGAGLHMRLPPAVVKFLQVTDFLRWQGANRGGGDLPEVGDDARVDGVGLGELIHGLGEVAHLAGIDDDGGEAIGQQGTDGGFLVGAGRFEDDPLGGEGLGPGDQLGDAGCGVGEASAGGGRPGMGVEEVLRDIDADESAGHEGGS
jgi:HAD superfamily phosphoserine phosphatase-like hydrolase